MEYVDIYDERMQPLGVMSKKEAHIVGAWHKSIHCWILREDESGKYVVFQKRSATKSSFPNYLDISAAGHYQTGEKIEDGVREIVEELGINVEYGSLKYLGIKFDIYCMEGFINREFCETFLYYDKRQLFEYSIDCDEVTGLVQIDIQKGLDLFSGVVDCIEVDGLEYNPSEKKVLPIQICITRDNFIDRIDPYYAKIFMIAKAYFNGERQLFI